MKSGKQRRAEIKRNRALKNQLKIGNIKFEVNPPIEADHNKLKSPSCLPRFPRFYYDKLFKCRRCGADQVWTPKQQKWWYETIGGNIETTAVYCRPCRIKERLRKLDARRIHLEGLARNNGSKI